MPTLKIEVPKPDSKGFNKAAKEIGRALDVIDKKIKRNDKDLKEFNKTLKTSGRGVGKDTPSRGDRGRSGKLSRQQNESSKKLTKSLDTLNTNILKLDKSIRRGDTDRGGRRGGGGRGIAGAAAGAGLGAALGRAAISEGAFRALAGSGAGAITTLRGVSVALGTAGIAAGLFATAIFGTVIAVKSTVKPFADFETALVDTGRIINTRGNELRSFGRDFQSLSAEIPIATNELLKFAGLGARFGIKGIDNLKEFTTTAARLQIVLGFTNNNLGKLARVIKLIDFPIGDIGEFGNALAVLDQNLATTSPQILEIALSVARASREFKFGAKDVLAFAGVFAEAGLQGRGAGRALREILSSIRSLRTADISNLLEGLTAAADGTRLTVEQFERLRIIDPAKLLQIISQRSVSVSQSLDVLGVNGAKASEVFTVLSTKSETLQKSLDLASGALENQNTLLDQAGEKTNTLNAQVTILSNNLKTLQVRLGETFADKFGLTEQLKDLNTGLDVALNPKKFLFRLQKGFADLTRNFINPAGDPAVSDAAIKAEKERRALEEAAEKRALEGAKTAGDQRRVLEKEIFNLRLQNLDALGRQLAKIERQRQDDLANANLLTKEEEKRLRQVIDRLKLDKDNNKSQSRAIQLQRQLNKALSQGDLINAQAAVRAQAAIAADRQNRPSVVNQAVQDTSKALEITQTIAATGILNEMLDKERNDLIAKLLRAADTGNTLNRQQLDTQRTEKTFNYVPSN